MSDRAAQFNVFKGSEMMQVFRASACCTLAATVAPRQLRPAMAWSSQMVASAWGTGRTLR